MTNITLPNLEAGKQVVIAFSGGIDSTLLAKLAVDKYGAENVIVLYNGLSQVRDILEGNSRAAKSATILARGVDHFNYMADQLGITNKLVADSYEKFNFGIHNLLTDMHRLNFVTSALDVVAEQGYDRDNLAYLFFGHNALHSQARELANLDSMDGRIKEVDESIIQAHVDSHPEQFSEVIKYGVMESMNDYFTNNIFYHLDDSQYVDQLDSVLFIPFASTTKQQIVSIYKEMGLEDLLNKTVSCFRGPDYPAPCNKCKNCKQREIAMS